MSIHLSPRLQAIADLVPRNARLIDVGTDHGKLPVWLVQNDYISHAWASDIRPGPLASARRLVAETQCEDMIDLRLTDGLNGFGANDGNVITIAGMGGETILAILSAAVWTKNNTLLILEPQSKQALLRRWLLENGYNIRTESLVADAGRIYPILTVFGGRGEVHSDAELYTGRFDLISSDPLFPPYLDGILARVLAAAPYDENAKAHLYELMSMRERLKNANCP